MKSLYFHVCHIYNTSCNQDSITLNTQAHIGYENYKIPPTVTAKEPDMFQKKAPSQLTKLMMSKQHFS